MATPETAERGMIGRRAFLGGLLGAGALVLLPGAASAARRKKKFKVAYRLSTRGRRCCGACKAHGANRFYRNRKAADQDRAHAGCNCAIVTQRIPRRVAKGYFPKRRKVYDLRWQEV